MTTTKPKTYSAGDIVNNIPSSIDDIAEGSTNKYYTDARVRTLLAGENIVLGAGTPAAAGSNQGDATALTKDLNAVTSADGTKGVKLPTAAAGKAIRIINTAAAVLKVYPASSGTINALAQDAAFSVGASKEAVFIASSATQWYAADFAGTSIQTHIADPVGGGTQDAEARTAIIAILDALEAYKILATA